MDEFHISLIHKPARQGIQIDAPYLDVVNAVFDKRQQIVRAARLDFDWTPVGELLERMDEFFSGSAGWPSQVRRVLAFEAEKVYHPEKRYARMEACHV